MTKEEIPYSQITENKSKGNSTVIMFGAGECFDINFREALNTLGPAGKRIIIDKDFGRISKVSEGLRIQADAFNLPLSFADIQNAVAVIGIPYHLPAIKEAYLAGIRNLVVEKPMVNNIRELALLDKFLEEHPDLKLYPLDYYLQKAIPLGVLTRKISPTDPRFNLVVDEDNKPFKKNPAGSLVGEIGNIDEINISIVEGGGLGVPNLEKRPWLEDDPLTGGMLLDLGTHAFVPLFYYGIIKPEDLAVISASRMILSPDRKTLIPRKEDKPEVYAQANLLARLDERDVKVNLRVGKVPEEGRWSKTIIHGEAGDIILGLKKGDPLEVKYKNGANLRIKLKDKTYLYVLALEEASQYFRGELDIRANYQAMTDSIRLIDTIKSVS